MHVFCLSPSYGVKQTAKVYRTIDATNDFTRRSNSCSLIVVFVNAKVARILIHVAIHILRYRTRISKYNVNPVFDNNARKT